MNGWHALPDSLPVGITPAERLVLDLLRQGASALNRCLLLRRPALGLAALYVLPLPLGLGPLHLQDLGLGQQRVLRVLDACHRPLAVHGNQPGATGPGPAWK